MRQIIHWYFKTLEFLIVLCLAAMCIMVFSNVVLRHFFDSGINIAEELSRFMFIWLTFLGAIVAMREGGHLGVDMLVARLSGRPLFYTVVAAQALIALCCAVLLWGLLKQHSLNVANSGLVTGISLSVVYSAAYLCAASIGLSTLYTLLGLLRGKINPATLIQSHDIDQGTA
ncbi:TRAP transporter small permease [Alcaligenaceae bacterium]|nr:TRAP transporter small permease [Alcaligenaceae bacterium]